VLSVKSPTATIENARQRPARLVVDPRAPVRLARTAILLGRAEAATAETMARGHPEAPSMTSGRKTRPGDEARIYHEIDASDPNKISPFGPGCISTTHRDRGRKTCAARATSAYPQLSAEESAQRSRDHRARRRGHYFRHRSK